MSHRPLKPAFLARIKPPSFAVAPDDPSLGSVYYNTVEATLNVWNGEEWVDLGAPGYDEFAEYAGDGSDGDVTLTENITLTRDMHYSALDTAGWNITTAGYRIFCTGSMIVRMESVISASGLHGAANVAGGFVLGSAGNGYQGGAGGTTAAGGNSVANAVCLGGQGGVGGAGSAGAGGTAGAASNTGYGAGGPKTRQSLYTMFATGNTQFQAGLGGSGGGAGSGNGGGGGGGGGTVWICARDLTFENSMGTLQSRGGNGGNAVGTNAGGGGGGGGGVIVYLYQTLTGTPNIDQAGGIGGTANGTGVAGANGSAGTNVYSLQIG